MRQRQHPQDRERCGSGSCAPLGVTWAERMSWRSARWGGEHPKCSVLGAQGWAEPLCGKVLFVLLFLLYHELTPLQSLAMPGATDLGRGALSPSVPHPLGCPLGQNPGRQEGRSWGQPPCPGWQMSPLVLPLLCPSTAPARTCSDLTSRAAHSRCHQTSPSCSRGATVLQIKPGGSSFPVPQPCCKPWENAPSVKSQVQKYGEKKKPQCFLVSPEPY